MGRVPDVGYTYDDSTAVEDGVWFGLPLDEDNEYDMTEERLEKWVEQLKKSSCRITCSDKRIQKIKSRIINNKEGIMMIFSFFFSVFSGWYPIFLTKAL